MADRTVQILPGGQSSAPFTYTIPASTAFTLLAVRATFDGTSAGGAFLPCVQLVSDAGIVMAETIGSSVAAGGSADASFFPWVKRQTVATSGNYLNVINTLRGTNQLVWLVRLNEGATPYADTAGFVPGDPANAARVAQAVAMTQNYSPPALSGNQDASAVAFNADGTGGGNGDFLNSGAVDNTRFQIFGNGSYTIIAWVRPFGGAATSFGGVVACCQIHSWSPPTGNTTGAMLGINSPARTVGLFHFNSVNYGAAIPTVTGSAISANHWHMVAATYDGANARIYIDGVLDTGPTALASGVASTNAPTIGVGQDSQANPQYFYGAVQEVSLWRAALSAGNISALYTAGTT